jgi:hypothetical protein
VPRVPLASRAILSKCRHAAWRTTIPPNGTEASEQRFCGGDAPSAEPASNVSRILFATLISPEVAEPVGRKLGVADGVLDVLVAEIMLQGSGIVPVVGKLIAARMPQHVRMQ